MQKQDFGFPEIAAEEAGFSAEGLAAIDAWMQDYVGERKLAELSLAVLRDGQLVYGQCLGPAILANSAPTTPTTIHRIFSMTKPVTGVATMILLERGLFQLDDPVAHYLPEFAAPVVLSSDGSLTPAERPISIRHLLTHTAGLSYGFLESGPVDSQLQELKLDAIPGHINANSLAEWCSSIAALPLVAHPGTRWQYSIAMDVLGRLIEVLSGQPFDDFLRTEILAPLKMVDTDFFVPPEKQSRLATCYRHTVNGIQEIERKYKPFLVPPKIPLGGAGLVSTLTDYLRFSEMLRLGGTLEDALILNPSSVELMTTNHLGQMPLALESKAAPLSSLPSMASFRGEGFGLTGTVTVSPEQSRVKGPAGPFAWGGAASTSFWVDRGSGISVVQLAQLLPSSTYNMRRETRDLVYGAML